MAKLGRPPKNNCDYFRHFNSMRNHRKVKALRNRFGQVLGYAFWSMMLEYLTESDGNEMEYSDLEVELFAAELGVSATEIRDMVDFCVKLEMLFLEDNFINSKSLDEELKFVYERRETAKEISKTRKRRKDGSFSSNTEPLGISTAESPSDGGVTAKTNPQIREDKIRKEINSDFEVFRILYPGIKKGNQTEFKNFQKKHKDWKTILPQLPEIIKKQIEQRRRKALKKEFIPDWKHLSTWINNRCWEEETPLVDAVLPDGRINPNGTGYAIDPQAYMNGTMPQGTPIKK